MSPQLVFDHYPLPKATLPAGWVVVSVGDIAKLVSSGFPSGAHNQDRRGVPHIRPMNIDREGRLNLDVLKYIEGDVPRELTRGDVLFNNTNSPELIGKTTALLIDGRFGYSNHMTRIRPEAGVSPIFISHQLHFLWMSGYFRHRCVNHVNQASISADPLSETVPLLLPPTGEQERIADVLDELLSDLDAGVAALEQVRAKLAFYRAAILKATVDGTLSADWRQHHPHAEPASELLKRVLIERRQRWEEAKLKSFWEKALDPPSNWKGTYREPAPPDTSRLPKLADGWSWASVEQLSSLVTSGSRGWREYYANEGAMFIRSQDIRTDRIKLDNVAHVTPPKNAEGKRTHVRSGDLLVTITGANVAKAAVVDRDLGEAYVSQHVGLIRLVKPNLGKFLHLFLVAPSGGRKQLLVLAYGAGKPGLNLDNLRELCVPLAPEFERDALLEAVEDQLSVIDHLECDLDAQLGTAQALRQSILRHAFSGQLVPQNPNDEPASELLKRIASEREARARGGAATRRPRRQRTTSGPRRRRARKLKVTVSA